MKKILLIAFLPLLMANFSCAQEKQDLMSGYKFEKKRSYKTWITLTPDQLKLKGFLYEKNDSSIIVWDGFKDFKEIDSAQITYAELMNRPLEFSFIPLANIEKMKARRKGRIGRGVFIGALTGFAIGGLIGLIDGDDPPDTFMAYTAGDKAIVLGLPLAVVGAGVGGLLGSIKVTIPLN